MIIRVIFTFIILFAAIMLGLQLKSDPGYVLISYHHWTIESSLWVSLTALIIVFVLTYILLAICRCVIRIPVASRRWINKYRMHKAQAKTRQGLIEFSEGHWQKAKTHLIQALPAAETPLLNYLAAARAAQEMGDSQSRDNYLREAQQALPEAKMAVGLTQAELQIENQQWEQALATLQHLQQLTPQQPHVLKLLMQLYQKTGAWAALISLLPALKQQKIVSKSTFESVQHTIYLQRVLELIKQQASSELEILIRELPKPLVYDHKITYAYVKFLLEKNNFISAEKILRTFLKKQFDEQLVELYGQLPYNIMNQKFIETLLKSNPYSGALLLCLGRLCKAQNLWGKAKSYLESSIQYGASVNTFIELGQLLEQLNDQNGACSVYRQGLLHYVAHDK